MKKRKEPRTKIKRSQINTSYVRERRDNKAQGAETKIPRRTDFVWWSDLWTEDIRRFYVYMSTKKTVEPVPGCCENPFGSNR